MLVLAKAMDRDAVAGGGEPAVEPPGAAIDAVDLGVEADVGARLHHLLGAEPAAIAPGAAQIRAQA